MDKIRRQVARARRLLWAQTILNILSWCCIAAFSVAFVGLLVPKLWYLDYTFRSWSIAWLGSATVATLLVTSIVAYFYRPSAFLSAIEVDRRFGLRERLSSALHLSSEERDSSVGQALLQDAETKVDRIDVRDQFPIRMAPQSPWIALPIIACAALFWVPDAEERIIKQAAGDAAERINNVKRSTNPILKQIEKQRELAEQKGDQEAVDEFKRIENKLKDLQKSSDIDAKKLLTDLNAIKEEMKQRKDALGSAENLKKSFDGLKDIDKGPAEKTADAIKNGDFDKASSELDKMLDKMRSGQLTPDQEKQLANQLEQMQKAIEKAREQQEQLKAEAKQELEKAEKAGDLAKAGALRQKLEKLAAGEKQAANADKLKQQMAKAQQAMKNGDKEGAQKALEEMKEDLENMAADQKAAEELEEMMDELDDAKKSSGCKECNGQGCAQCQGKGKGQKKADKPGDGQGEGQGMGDRDEKENDTKNFDSQVREQMRKGETTFGGKIAGKNRKGITTEQMKETVLSSQPDSPDAIENMTLPKAQRDQQREYFDSLRGPK